MGDTRYFGLGFIRLREFCNYRTDLTKRCDNLASFLWWFAEYSDIFTEWDFCRDCNFETCNNCNTSIRRHIEEWNGGEPYEDWCNDAFIYFDDIQTNSIFNQLEDLNKNEITILLNWGFYDPKGKTDGDYQMLANRISGILSDAKHSRFEIGNQCDKFKIIVKVDY